MTYTKDMKIGCKVKILQILIRKHARKDSKCSFETLRNVKEKWEMLRRLRLKKTKMNKCGKLKYKKINLIKYSSRKWRSKQLKKRSNKERPMVTTGFEK